MALLPHLRRGLLVAVALTAVAGAGCAGSTAPTKEEYVAVADDVCRQTQDKLEEAEVTLVEETAQAAEDGETSDYQQRPDRWTRAKIIPLYRQMRDGLRGIPPPDGDAEYLADLYDDLARLVDDLHYRPGQGRDLIRKDAELEERFSSYGMKVCGTV